MKRRWRLGALAGAVSMVAAFLSAPASAATSCDATSMQAASPADTTIVSADEIATPIPNCEVIGYVTTTNPGPNRVNFRVQLPDRNLWNHRFYFMGLGGAAGSMPPAPPRILSAGFVVAVTDTGHQADTLDWSFMSDRVKALDHIHRGGHVATVASQQLTRAYYGVESFFRYHVGCSGGGRMGTEAIRHHPEDYDGVMIGGNGDASPAGYAGDTMLKFIQASQEQSRPGGWVSPAKLQMIDAHVTAACDDTDGAHDGMVWDPRLCHYDVSQLRCAGADGPDCLTDSQIQTVKAIIAGPRGRDGRQLSYPMPISNISMWQFNGAAPPPWSSSATMENLRTASAGYVIATTMARGFLGPDYDVLRDMDFSDAALARWSDAFRAAGYSIPLEPSDLVAFQRRGGKMLQWSGISDPCCTFVGEQQTNDKVAQALGGRAQVDAFYALYGVPGMGHCGGGDGPEDGVDLMLQTLIDWVEKGKAPGAIVAHRGADRVRQVFGAITTTAEAGVPIGPGSGTSRDYLMCRYPLVSVFDKSKAGVPGAVYDAANWSCRASRN